MSENTAGRTENGLPSDFFDRLRPFPHSGEISVWEVTDFLCRESADILVVTHARPDGDAIGSALALRTALRQLGRRCEMLCDDLIRPSLSFLLGDGVTALPADLPKNFRPEYIITVDVADSALLGDIAGEMRGHIALKIDHHRTGENFADAWFIRPDASACGEMIFDIIRELDVLDRENARPLYAAIAADTGSFKYSNVTSRTFLTAAELISLDIGHAEISAALFDSHTPGELAATAAYMSALRYEYEGRVALLVIDNRFKSEHGIDDECVADINSLPRTVSGVEVGVTVKERSDRPGHFKISMRSGSGADVSAVCARFGGGGHIRAAGCEIAAPDSEAAVAALLGAVGEALK